MPLNSPAFAGRLGRTLSAAIRAARRQWGYDATESKNRRKAPDGILRSEDAELTPDQRRKLLSSARDIQRNFTLAGWMVRKHLDYVSTFNFQSKTGNKELDRLIEKRMRWRMRKENCDVSGRYSLQAMLRAVEARRTIDGDVFLLKLADGRLQAIEGDRVRTPTGGFPGAARNAGDFLHGVRCDQAGKAIEFAVCRRGRSSDFSSNAGTFVFERFVPASNCWQHAYFSDRFDQVRGIAPMAPAINTLRDCYEGFDYALAKMKVAQLFGLAVYRLGDDPIGESSTDDDGGLKIDFGKGPLFLDLNKEDKAEFLESKSPSVEFQQFGQTMISCGLKGLDIPYSFYSENFTNFSGQRQAWIQYDLSARAKRCGNIELLDGITDWWYRMDVEDGILPQGIDVESQPWRWLSTGVPWIDPLKEVQADVQAIAAGLASRTRILREQGEDFEEIAAELAAEKELLESLGLPVDVQPANSQIVEIAGNAV